MKRTPLMIGLGLVVVIAAVLFLRGSRAVPSNAGQTVLMHCQSCGAGYALSLDEFGRLAEARGGDPRASAEDPLALAIPCKECGKKAALRDWDAERARNQP